MTGKILVIDDDQKTVELVKLYLESEGFIVFSAYDGQAALDLTRRYEPDLIVLDLMLPKINGMEVCKIIRSDSQVPIIMLTARTTEDDKLNGLNLGADDYIVKPFSPREVLARVKAVLRRAQSFGNLDQDRSEQIQFGNLSVDSAKHEASVGNFQINLTPKEFKLLKLFVRQPGRAFSRNDLIEEAFGKEYEGLVRTIDVHVMNLRRKIEEIPDITITIKTVYGTGYKLVEKSK